MIANIVRYSEIGLKGKNRAKFENKLIDNIKKILKRSNVDFSIKRYPGRILVYSENNISDLFKFVFGISSVSPSFEIELDIEKIKNEIKDKLKEKRFSTFRISVQRLNKEFKMTSQDIENEIGAFVAREFNKKVSLKEFDLNIQIEIMNKAYLFFERIKCFGGLPVGIEGKAICLIESEDSLAACWLAMKRGCSIFPVSYSEFSLDGLQRFSPEKIELRKINDFKEIESIAMENNINALVVSDTLDRLKEYKTNLLVLRPLVGEEDNIKKIIDILK